MTSRLETPNPEVQKAQIRANERRELKKLDRELKLLDVGLLGRLLGSHEHSPLNTAAFICFMFYVTFMTIIFVPSEMLTGKAEILAIIAGIILPIVGYLLGRGSSR